MAYPHGWGHSGGWQGANAQPGRNLNEITPATSDQAEQVSGVDHADDDLLAVARHLRHLQPAMQQEIEGLGLFALLEDRFVELAGGRRAAEGLEWLHKFSD